METLLELQHLCIEVPAGSNQSSAGGLVNEVSIKVAPQSRLTLIGETGSGKSLIAHAVLGLLPNEMRVSGRISYQGRNLLELSQAKRRAFWGKELFLFPQEPASALNPTMRALGQVAETFRWALRLGSSKSSRQAAALLEKVGLDPGVAGKRFPFQLSGGMQQRLLAAITLAQPAKLIIADEPTKGLDRKRRDLVVELLKGLSAQGKTVITITHDLEVARQLGGSLAVLYGGYLMEQGSTKTLLETPSHPYTRALLAALPENGLHPIPLADKALSHDKGCVFDGRCSEVSDICHHSPPCWERFGEGRFLRCHVCGMEHNESQVPAAEAQA
jgi:oligopeptide/dipeptide ABC transporter ATP-binding protein